MIQVKDLDFAYRRKPPLFSSLDLELEDGNIYGLLGKNGAGKTTLLKIISGLLFPKQGQCLVNGVEPGNRSPQLLSQLFFIGEEFVLPLMRAENYVRFYSPFYPEFDRNLLNTALDEFEFKEQGPLKKMSYGQMKKFLIAFGLACRSRILILDEPTNGLDIPAKSQFRKLMAGSISEDRIFLISTHQVRDMQNLIDPVVILDQGKIVFSADSNEISSKVSVEHRQTQPGDDQLYSEKVPLGYACLSENTDEKESQVDLEILFNAVTRKPAEMQRLFSRPT